MRLFCRLGIHKWGIWSNEKILEGQAINGFHKQIYQEISCVCCNKIVANDIEAIWCSGGIFNAEYAEKE